LLVGVPAIALLTAEISGYFFFHHCGDNPLSMPQQISDLKEILPRNRYLNFLDTHRQNAVVKIASNPRLTSQKQQQAVRKYLAKINYGVAPLVIKPLDDFKVSFFPKDGDSSNQAKNNLGIKFELGDSNRKSVKFRIWPEGEDPPKKSMNLMSRLMCLNILRSNISTKSITVNPLVMMPLITLSLLRSLKH
jgi:hypothetical protein